MLTPEELEAYYKGLYEKHGEGRTNLAYGYINKS